DGDARDHSGNGHDATVHGQVEWAGIDEAAARRAARFNGRDAFLEIPSPPQLATRDFTLSLLVHTDETWDDLPGDLVSQYDAERRRGWQLTLKTNSGVTTSQANDRPAQLGIDDGRQSEWQPRGRPGNALMAFALAVHDGALYAGTCEPGKDESGHVYRYDGGETWTDLGSLDGANSVTALAQYKGHLYAATG